MLVKWQRQRRQRLFRDQQAREAASAKAEAKARFNTTREAVLQQLGFSSYKAYLASALWRELKQRLVSGADCAICRSRKAVTLHHTRYDLAALSGKSTEDIHPVCRACHRKLHVKRGAFVDGSTGRKALARAQRKEANRERKRTHKWERLEQIARSALEASKVRSA